MADFGPDLSPEELEALAQQLPEDFNMEEFIANLTKLTKQFVSDQGEKPLQMQFLVFFGFLLIPLSLMLYCFCKILSSQRKRAGKDKKKQKEQKKETKKKA